MGMEGGGGDKRNAAGPLASRPEVGQNGAVISPFHPSADEVALFQISKRGGGISGIKRRRRRRLGGGCT